MKLDDLFRPTRHLSFLAGSGISFDAPSCQPTANQFTKALITRLVPKEKQKLVESLTDLPTSHVGAARFIRFEQLMQLLQRWDPDLHVLDGYTSCDVPNANHCALAHFIIAEHSVFTTNFDNLLEQALLTVGAPLSSIVPVIFENDSQLASGAVHRVFKLHGSLNDFRTGTDSRRSVQATLRQIAAGKGGGLQLESWKIGLLERALQNTDLVVVGYSGLDDFDVLPTLRRIRSAQRLIWIDHASDIALPDAEVEVLSSRDPGRALRRLDSYLDSLAGSCRDADRIVVVRVHTLQFLVWLAAWMLAKDCSLPTARCSETGVAQFQVELDLSEGEKWYFAGDVLSYFDTHEATVLLRRSVEIARVADDRLLLTCSLTYLGRQYETLAQLEQTADAPFQDNWEEALRCYNEAWQIAKSLPGVEGHQEEAKAIGNIGQLYLALPGSLSAAVDHYRQALSIDERIDDLEGIAREVNNLGAAEHKRGNLDEAAKLLARACEIDKKLGDLSTLALHLHNLGLCRLEQGNPAGVEDVVHALEIAKSVGLRDVVALCLDTMGTLQKSRRHFEEALEIYQEALTFAVEPDISLAPLLRARIANIASYLQRVTNLGLLCACGTPLYFTNQEHKVLLDGAQLLTKCVICQHMIFVRNEETRFAAYKVAEFRDGKVAFDQDAISARPHSAS